MLFLGESKLHLIKSSKGEGLSVILGLSVFFALVAWIFLPSTFAGPTANPDSRRRQIEQIETDLSRETEQFLELGSKEKTILGQLAEIEKKISEKRKILEEIQAGIRLSRDELERRNENLRRLQRASAEARERMEKRLTAFYKYSKRGYVHLLATSIDLDQFRKRLKYLQVIMDEDQRMLSQMVHVQEEMIQEIALISEKLTIIDAMEKKESDRLASIREELDKKVFLIMRIHNEKEFYETLVKELQLAAHNLKETLLNLDRNQETRNELPPGFARSKGKLPLPVNGKIVKGHEPLGAEAVKAHKGIFIQGPLGAEIKAIFPGRVDFSGWLKGYGQTIVINHGSRFFTVSAHLSERYKEEGDKVEAGAIIGLLGHTGPFPKPSLYFEIRRAGTAVNPSKWVKGD
jgi:septal ring factor EnvC (AmiA/AmiB activator)